jgi:hypothetical protein
MKKTRATILLPLVITVCLVSAAQAFGQRQTPQARKFDEFTIGTGSPELRWRNYEEHARELRVRVAQYARQLRLEGAQPYIIGYSPRVVEWEIYNRSVAESRGNELRPFLTGFDYRRITIINGGFREVATTELWVVPSGAQPPVPTPTVSPENVAYCPFVRVQSPPYVPRSNSPIEFKAIVEVNDRRVQPTFAWRVSQGNIIRGQGSDTILVELPNGASGEVVTRVEVNGYSIECPIQSTAAISTTTVGVSHFKLDEFGDIQLGDTKARLDNLAITLQDDPTLQAHIVAYGARVSPPDQAASRAASMRNYLIQERGVAPERIIAVNGGYRNELSGELWLSLRGTGAPPTRSTVDERYVRILRTQRRN